MSILTSKSKLVHSSCGTKVTYKNDGISDFNGSETRNYSYTYCEHCDKRTFSDLKILDEEVEL